MSGVRRTLRSPNGACNVLGSADQQTHLDTSPNEDLITGTLVASPTPEPSSLLLRGTGLLGFAGILTRKH